MFEYLRHIGETPDTIEPAYRCDDCGATGTRMFRQHSSMNPDIRCVPCIEKRYNVVVFPETWEVKGYVPAIPSEDGTGWYWLASIPESGAVWWRSLPLRPVGVGAPKVPWIKVPKYGKEWEGVSVGRWPLAVLPLNDGYSVTPMKVSGMVVDFVEIRMPGVSGGILTPHTKAEIDTIIEAAIRQKETT